ATDGALMRNFSPRQKFWAFGQTVIADFHLSKKESVYAWLSYFSPGRFNNRFSAPAFDPFTTPASVSFKVNGVWENREVSVGWKHYFIGGFNEERNWSVYGRAGFGLMFNGASNSYVPIVDTNVYDVSSVPLIGESRFNRLTIDLATGIEIPFGGNFYFYSELRTAIPSSDYPAPVLHYNKNVPMPLILAAGLRVSFDMGY
ncbi:MAG: hypothetical protein ACXWCT_16360, partial [Flavitalea sp.]